MDTVFFIVCKIFPFQFIETLDSKGILTWKGITSNMECADLETLLRYVINKILFTSPEAMVI